MAEKTEKQGVVKLTGETNRQEMPARVYDDKAAQDNRNRVQSAKEADRERALLPEQRERLDNPEDVVEVTLRGGTRVAGPKELVEGLRRAEADNK